jgi:hypothetical protein
MVTVALSIAMFFIMAGVIVGLAAFGVASLGALVAIGFKIGAVMIPLLIGISLIKWALSNI